MAASIYRGGRPFVKPGLRFGNNTGIFNLSGAPVNGTSGSFAGTAGPGSVILSTSGLVYVNTNTKASPTWVSTTAGAITGGSVTGATLSANINSDGKSLAASVTHTSTITPVALTGFSWSLVAGATYHFDVDLATTMTTSGGLNLAFALTTATLTSIRYNTYAATASDNTTAVSTTGTTATTGTNMFSSKTAAYTAVRAYGSFVVNAAGSIAFTTCQETSAGGGDVTIVLINSTARVVRVL